MESKKHFEKICFVGKQKNQFLFYYVAYGANTILNQHYPWTTQHSSQNFIVLPFE